MFDAAHESPPLPLRNEKDAMVLAILRIAVGFFFLVFGQYKVFGTAFVRSGFHDYVEGFSRDGAYPFMVPVLRWILAHAATAMALVVGYGEFLIGISLVIGLLSRVASIFGCALMLAMWLSGGYPRPHAAFWMYWGSSLNRVGIRNLFRRPGSRPPGRGGLGALHDLCRTPLRSALRVTCHTRRTLIQQASWVPRKTCALRAIPNIGAEF